ncbi:two-partner secretion domain-containing protein [Calothrix sp. NIES-3974]|uniref:two-partner secretion domain-containing protein n=1 Tax=Calothrix sp. NIES-3974 TaxID=2005462 RepID=UPI0012FD6EF3|nr:filamentous hemagglutinin N-terminal domain-containing protein [Calothrix sp. NIES-3974]
MINKSYLFCHPCILLGLLLWSGTPTNAQIIPDNTLGAEASRVTPNALINGGSADRIEGGVIRDVNLFHSFREFNVGDGQRVYFTNPSGIQNILSRVTGGNPSNIFGTLGVDGGANLFLINPNGILFGQNASLDVRGSFVGTTANSVQFGNQGLFSATNPEAPPLLTINPSALLFNQINQNAAIVNQSQAPAGVSPNGNNTTGLRVPDGKSLLLVGGNINLAGGSIRAYDGRVELTGLAAPGSVGLNRTGDIFSLDVPVDIPLTDVSLGNGSIISVFGNRGGDVAINAGNIRFQGAAIFAGIGTGRGTGNTQAGNVSLNATGAISLEQDSYIDNSVYGNGKAGNVSLQAGGSVNIVNSFIFTNIEAGGVGSGGNIKISADSLSLLDGSQLLAILRRADPDTGLPAARGNGGNVNINVRNTVNFARGKDVFNGIATRLESGTEGNGGNVLIQAGGTVSFDNALITSSVEEGAVGNGGNMTINAGTITLKNASELNSRTLGKGNAGNITLNALGEVSLDGLRENPNDILTRVITAVIPGGEGKAGDIEVNAGSLSLSNGAFLSSGTIGKGDGGNITLNIQNATVLSNQSGFQSNIFRDGSGKGGDILLNTGSLTITGGSNLTSSVSGQGNAGNITVNVRDRMEMDDINSNSNSLTGILTSLLTDSVGQGGNVEITTGSLLMKNGAQISANSFGKGNAGNISVNARDVVRLETGEDSRFSSRIDNSIGSDTEGNSGKIQVTARELSFTGGSGIAAANFGQGNGGNVEIRVSDRVSFDGVGSRFRASSGVSTFTTQGKGGDISIETGTLSLTNGANLSSFAPTQAGNININTRDAVIIDGVGSNTIPSSLSSSLESGGNSPGKGGDIQITTGSLSVTNGGQINAGTLGNGNGGNITINARDSVVFAGGDNSVTGAYTTVEATGVGDAGNINLKTGSLSLNNGGQISATTIGKGKAGDIEINARDTINISGVNRSNGRISGVFSSVGTDSFGPGGNILVQSQNLFISDSGLINASTSGRGDAGNISIKVNDGVSLENSSYIRATVESGAVGTAGNIDIQSRTLSVGGGSQIQSALFRPSGNLPGAQGRGGNIKVNATDTVTLSGYNDNGFSSGLLTIADRGTSGDAGDITVTTGNFTVRDGAIVNAGTSGTGNGGNITINGNNFAAINGGQVSTSTAKTGNAGTIKLNIRNKINIAGSDPNFSDRVTKVSQRLAQEGQTDLITDVILNSDGVSGIFASTAVGSTGKSGSIIIDPTQITISDGARVSVNSEGSGDAGSISIIGDTLTLSNNGVISAQTNSSQGGDITLQLAKYLFLRGNSNISTTAGLQQGGGDGGNIKIKTPAIVAIPNQNNDITANAFTGKGGNINIETQALFGIEPRLVASDTSNDITASSELGIQGEVRVTKPDVDPTQGLVELAEGLADQSDKIGGFCPRDAREAEKMGEFTVTGRGGIAQGVFDPLIGSHQPDLATFVGEEGINENLSRKPEGSTNSTVAIPNSIVEAQGWVKTPDGKVILVANLPQADPTNNSGISGCVMSKK